MCSAQIFLLDQKRNDDNTLYLFSSPTCFRACPGIDNHNEACELSQLKAWYVHLTPGYKRCGSSDSIEDWYLAQKPSAAFHCKVYYASNPFRGQIVHCLVLAVHPILWAFAVLAFCSRRSTLITTCALKKEMTPRLSLKEKCTMSKQCSWQGAKGLFRCFVNSCVQFTLGCIMYEHHQAHR